MTENEIYYLTSILRFLRAIAESEENGPTLGGEILHDNIDWLDCYIEAGSRNLKAD